MGRSRSAARNPARGREGVPRLDVAEIGGWSLRQVQKWCADGTLPAMMYRRHLGDRRAEICDMLGIEGLAMPMEAFRKMTPVAVCLAAGPPAARWTGRGPVVAASPQLGHEGAASQLDCGVSQHER